MRARFSPFSHFWQIPTWHPLILSVPCCPAPPVSVAAGEDREGAILSPSLTVSAELSAEPSIWTFRLEVASRFGLCPVHRGGSSRQFFKSRGGGVGVAGVL